MTGYTPTTAQIRYAAILGMVVANSEITTHDRALIEAQFDRWLEQHDDQVRDQTLVDVVNRLRATADEYAGSSRFDRAAMRYAADHVESLREGVSE